MNSVLYVSSDLRVIIIDTPSSIAAAQVFHGQPYHSSLVSEPAIQTPWQTPEPQSTQVRESLHASQPAELQEYVELVRAAKNHLDNALSSDFDFCHPRNLSSGLPLETEQTRLPSRNRQSVRFINQDHENAFKEEFKDWDGSVEETFLYERTFCNPLGHEVGVFFTARGESQIAKSDFPVFLIPPNSKFFLGDCRYPAPLRALARNQGPYSVLSYADEIEPRAKGRFDIIVMDPPWPNRSAHRGAPYNVMAPKHFQKIGDMLLGMDLDAHLTHPGSYAAVWITNNQKCRDILLGEGGLFDAWGVELVEEWIWVKTTKSGEPIFDLDGVWRKPFEVCLIGRAPEAVGGSPSPTRRVIFGVPDLHSRKPCLRDLFSRVLFPRNPQFSALEIFARHLVAGWTSCGNEVLKYQDLKHWVDTPVHL